jgi:quercetin dioxygenase-like cupin family protein
MSEISIRPWAEGERPTEGEIRDILDEEGLQPYRWSNAPGDVYAAHTHPFHKVIYVVKGVYAAHTHPFHKVIYVVKGSITFGFPGDGGQATLQAGDRLELPAGTAHDAVVGSEGVVCLEAHR